MHQRYLYSWFGLQSGQDQTLVASFDIFVLAVAVSLTYDGHTVTQVFSCPHSSLNGLDSDSVTQPLRFATSYSEFKQRSCLLSLKGRRPGTSLLPSDGPSGKKTCNLSYVNTTLCQINLLSRVPPAESLHIWAAEGLLPSGISLHPGAASLARRPLLPRGSVNSLSRQLGQFSRQPESQQLSSSSMKTWLFGRPVTSSLVRGASRRGVHADRPPCKQQHLFSKGCRGEDWPVRPCLGSGSLAVTSPRPFKALTDRRHPKHPAVFVFLDYFLFVSASLLTTLKGSTSRGEAFQSVLVWKTACSAQVISPGCFSPTAAGGALMRHWLYRPPRGEFREVRGSQECLLFLAI